jgi:hypothetical protein
VQEIKGMEVANYFLSPMVQVPLPYNSCNITKFYKETYQGKYLQSEGKVAHVIN